MNLRWQQLFWLGCCMHVHMVFSSQVVMKTQGVTNLTSHATEDHNVSQAVDENVLLQKALVLYEIIEAYAQTGAISVKQQELYSQYVDQIEHDIDALDPQKYTEEDKAAYREIYVDSYKVWQDFLKQEISNMLEKSPEAMQIEANTAKIQEIYQDVEQKIIMYEDEFSENVQILLEGLGEYSKANQDAYYKDLTYEVDTFKSYMKSVRNNAISAYFSYIKSYGQVVDSLHLTWDQHSLISGVTVMTQRAIVYIESIVLDLTTNMSSAVFAKQASDTFLKYEQQSEIDYQKALEANAQLGNKDAWTALKNSGGRIMKSFGGKMQEAAQKQAKEQAQKLLEEKGAELAKAIGKRINSLGGAVFAGMKEKAHDIGGEAFNKLQERAKVLGGQAFATFKDKVKILEYFKKLASDQIGIDVDGLAELLAAKGVSPITLQRVIKTIYPVPVMQKNAVIQVQEGTGLCLQEKLFVANRLKNIKKTLQEDFDITKPLRLAFSCSGGGNRAMIGTLGFFIGAARHKILDVSMYVTGLSGSTWAIAPWSYMYLKGFLSDHLETSLREFKDMLSRELDYACPLPTCPADLYPPDMLGSDIQMAFAHNIAKRFAYDQQITAVDLWGALVSNYALKKVGLNRLNITWSSMAQEVQKGLIPLPICSSVFDLKDRVIDKTGYRAEYKWFESGPFEAGSTLLGFIPVWALGSTFENGKIVSHAPEYEMSEFLGIYGSAFAVSVNDLIDKGIPLPSFTVAGIEIKLPVDTWIRNLIDGVKADVRAKRSDLVHAQFANYSKGLKNSVLKDKDSFGMFDGGMYFNIPLPLLFDRPERAIDVVIIYDSNPVDLHCLVDAARYFAKNGTDVPDLQIDPVTGKPISKDLLLSRLMTVFNDPRDAKTYKPQQPTLIYFPTPKTDISKIPYYETGSQVPRHINLAKYPDITMAIDGSKVPYKTANFKYTRAELNNLAQTMEAIFESQADEIKLILKLVSDKRNSSLKKISE